jgi:RNA ligase (TIGR02306 family)
VDIRGEIIGAFPGFISKTDETRIQSFPTVLDEMRGKKVVITVKCDGTSGTFAVWEDSFWVCGRNYRLAETELNPHWQVARKYNLEALLKDAGCALQGEIVGPGIQKNRLGLKEVDVRFFNLYDLAGRRCLPQVALEAFCARLNLPTVPVERIIEHFDLTMEELLAMADGYYSGTTNWREGIVVRPYEQEYDSPTLGGRLSFKVVSNTYLETGGE